MNNEKHTRVLNVCIAKNQLGKSCGNKCETQLTERIHVAFYVHTFQPINRQRNSLQQMTSLVELITLDSIQVCPNLRRK